MKSKLMVYNGSAQTKKVAMIENKREKLCALGLVVLCTTIRNYLCRDIMHFNINCI